MSNRIQRVNSLIKEEVGKILLKEIDFPRGVLVTVLKADTSPDLRDAKIYISVLPDESAKEIMSILKKTIYGIQQHLNERLRMRPTPKIRFVEDIKEKNAFKVDEILEKTKSGD